MTTAVTTLTVDARGARAGIAEYKQAMAEGAAAADNVVATNERLRQSIDKISGVSVSAQRGLDAIRAKLDPLVDAQQKFDRASAAVGRTLDSAVKQGLISAADAAELLTRRNAQLEQQYLGVARAAQQASSAANDNRSFARLGSMSYDYNRNNPDFSRLSDLSGQAEKAGKSVGLARHEVVQMQAQLSDLGIQVMSGGSPFIAIMQQGSQLAPILAGQGGVRGAIAAVGAGFMALLNPVNLSILAIAGLTAGLGYWLSSADEAQKKAISFGDAIKRIDDIMIATGQKTHDYAAEINGLTKEYRASQEAAIEAADAQVKALMAVVAANEIAGGLGLFGEGGALSNAEAAANIQRLQEALDVLTDLRRKLDEVDRKANEAIIGLPGSRRGIGSDSRYDPAVQAEIERMRRENADAASLGAVAGLPRPNPMRDLTSDYGLKEAEQQLKTNEKAAKDFWKTYLREGQLATKEINRDLEEQRQFFGGLAKGFINDLRNGVDLSQALLNVVNKIADRLMDRAIDALMQQIFPSAGGGGITIPMGAVSPSQVSGYGPGTWGTIIGPSGGIGSDARYPLAGSSPVPSGTAFGGITPSGPMLDILNKTAASYGISPQEFVTLARIESGFNPLARNGQHAGMFQFSPSTGEQYGLSAMGRFDPSASADAAARLWTDNSRALQPILGRPAMGWEAYVAHQQGIGGALALFGNPNMNAAAALNTLPYYADRPGLANLAITGNGGRLDMTSTEFLDLWKQKFAAMGGSFDAVSAASKSASAGLGGFGEGLGSFGNMLSSVQPPSGSGGGILGWLGQLFGGFGGLGSWAMSGVPLIPFGATDPSQFAGFGPGLWGFAKGGISDRPAIFGEAGPEAAVPLPDGRRIPVDLRGAGGRMSVTINNMAGVDIESRETQQDDGSWGAELTIRRRERALEKRNGLKPPLKRA